RLREILRFGKPDGFVMRREKATVPGLPAKYEHRISCNLSDAQRVTHMDLVSRARVRGEGSHPLVLLQHLMRLYQHPALFPVYNPISADEAVALSPKMQTFVECLLEIRQKREKVLIFTRTLDMQQLLASVIHDEFHLSVGIVNGATSRKSSTQ